MPHISVCICTYKRQEYLKRVLSRLDGQETGGLFTYSIVVADNDSLRSGEPIVLNFSAVSSIPIKYCVEPRQNIALARNKAVENAAGDFVAFLDDDELPENNWLVKLFNICEERHVEGALGSADRLFDEQPPQWIQNGNFYMRPIHPTGSVLDWKDGRTGNLLLRSRIFSPGEQPFNPEFRSGEDQDFFRRMIEKGRVFVWCADAKTHEIIPPTRWKRKYMLRKALLRGAAARLKPTCGPMNILKSVLAVLAYGVALPFTVLLGHHRFMTTLVKLCDHLGKVLASVGINPIKEAYVTQ